MCPFSFLMDPMVLIQFHTKSREVMLFCFMFYHDKIWDGTEVVSNTCVKFLAIGWGRCNRQLRVFSVQLRNTRLLKCAIDGSYAIPTSEHFLTTLTSIDA